LKTGEQLAVGNSASEPVDINGNFEVNPAGGIVPCLVIGTASGLQIQVDPFGDKP
jgi:hypothetical protein